MNPVLSKLSPDNNAINGNENSSDAKIKADKEILDRIVAKLKGDSLHNNRTIIESAGFGGGGDEGGCFVQASKIGDLDYFVRARITSKESVFDETSGQTLTYIYADVDEYEKMSGTTSTRDNESGLLVTNSNLTETEYNAARTNIPDLNPEQLLIVATQDSEINGGTEEFENVYLRYDNNVFSTVC